MGSGRWDRAIYKATSTTYATKSREQIFQNKSLRKDFDPKNITMRESFDPDENTEANSIIVALDVTGSMGIVAEQIAKHGLGTLVEETLDRQPVANPQFMMMAVGDAMYDSAPLQVTQFEADNRICEQLTELWVEGGGGGNSTESYDAPWAFAAEKTDLHCFSKRGKKGYLFTIGDENPPASPDRRMMKELYGINSQTDVTADEWLRKAQERYNVFHVLAEQGSHMSYGGRDKVVGRWKELMGQRVLLLDNYNHISQVIISAIEVSEGKDPVDVIKSWQDKSVQKSVEHALYGIDKY